MFTDEYYMKMAFQQAQLAFDKDEVPVGAIIVFRDRVIAKAHNLTETLNDVTAHAEMQAITAAANTLGGKYLNECSLYVTLEPCVMCAGGSAWAQMGKVVFGAYDQKKGFSKYQESILHPKTEVIGGVMELECGQLMTEFFSKKR
ncbi:MULTISPECIES: nucleoside deaminase [unclassified Lentimicrobium]|uniref:nucleoside deaminase n=1 Tax=unclassified Lentimicrobium TaxID=2677434 RepID=UPI001556313C|nr:MULTISPECIES: nucleoside deaminase [unclassified Lentimicrobium]NPD44611.1 nucleoside deaminase [Lentimicrobium sp. S6]NPD83323.1 nucleoside deaminase [Lentimicrobium sp. L6]